MDKKLIRNFAFIFLSTILVLVVVLAKDYKDIVKSFSNINFKWLFVTVFLVYFTHFCDIFLLRLNARKYKPNYSMTSAFKTQQTGVFFDAVTPFASGGQIAQLYLLRKQGINSKNGASILMFAFIVMQFIIVVFGITVLLLKFNMLLSIYSNKFYLVILGFAINFCVIVFMILSSFSKTFHRFIFQKIIPLLGRVRIMKNVDASSEKIEDWLKVFRTEFIGLLNMKSLVFARLVLNVLKLTIIYAIPFFVAKTVGVVISFRFLLDIIFLTGFVYMLTSFIPLPGATLGAESSFVLLFTVLFGKQTIAIMLLWRTVTYYMPMITGSIVFMSAKENRTMKRGSI